MICSANAKHKQKQG
ncbi:MAG: hypothetical protein LC642_04075 [Verrucomicrobiaceae bacterium]|nr:hypothetical protein [Verrucomicrobiaceae bacterium]